MTCRWSGILVVVAAGFFVHQARVHAQPAAVEQHNQAIAMPAEEFGDETLWEISAGMVLNYGNTRTFAGNAGTRLLLKRGANQFSGESQWTYGVASTRAEDGDFDDWDQNANNLTGLVRYDRFVTANNALFGAFAARRDTFAGLDLRLQFQAGYARNFFSETNHRFWGEVGYDGTYDNYDPDPLVDPSTMMELEGTEIVHSARIFAGYDNHITDSFTFLTGLEGLIDVQDTSNLRLNYKMELSAKMSEKLQFGFKFVLRFDNVPVEGTDELDTVSTLNLIYSLVKSGDAS